MNKAILILLLIVVIALGWFAVSTISSQDAVSDAEVAINEADSVSDFQEAKKTVLTDKINQGISMNAEITTNMGKISLELFSDKAPKTVENFTKLAGEGFYDGTRFHRVIEDFMIQGGDPLSRDEDQKMAWGTGGPGYTFEDEFNDEDMVQGALAMANAGPNTNGSQFFIVTSEEGTPWLKGKHTVFGKVTEGLDVVLKIGSTDVAERDVPVNDVIVEGISISN